MLANSNYPLQLPESGEVPCGERNDFIIWTFEEPNSYKISIYRFNLFVLTLYEITSNTLTFLSFCLVPTLDSEAFLYVSFIKLWAFEC